LAAHTKVSISSTRCDPAWVHAPANARRSSPPPLGLQVFQFVLGGVPHAILTFPAVALERAECLSPAERLVLSDVLRGLSIRDVARLRDRSEGTIRKQIASAYAKLGVGSRRELAAFLSLS
jgi:DNA-binding NarL/FixJ family response regulator